MHDFLNEVKILMKLRHPCCTRLLGYATELQPIMIMDLYPCNLSSALSNQLGLSIKKQITRDMISGLAYLHSLSIIHRDFKSSNILIKNDFHACITDFGQSNFMSQSISSKIVGTPFYLAPEAALEMRYTVNSDLYALGITLWEVFENNPKPYYHIQVFWKYPINPISILSQIHSKQLRPFFSDEVLKTTQLLEVIKLIEILWHNEPEKRKDLAFAASVIENISL